jgi:D-lactate dehydrogenase (cytochrome)
LGVITSVIVKLHPIPEHVVAAVCVFDSLTYATQAVAAIKLAESPITRCELLDASSVLAAVTRTTTQAQAAQQQKEQ